jgi:hypothetical protein
MANETDKLGMPPEIREVLVGLRRRIRGYVWLQGLALVIAWAGVLFWTALALDYLPVLFGAGEMPRAARAVLLFMTAAALAWVLYRWVLRRAFVPLSDRSMALLLERRHPRFQDSLITTVELVGRAHPSSDAQCAMLEATEQQAVSQLSQGPPTRVLARRPLFTSLIGAAVVSLTVLAGCLLNGEALAIGARRLYLLADELWPRNARIEVVGLEVAQSSGDADAAGPTLVPFLQRRVKVARGSSARLVVHADAAARVVPTTCTITYRTRDGERGRVSMTRVGAIRDQRRTYHFEERPLKDMLTDVTFDVLGFDHRLPQHVIEVVDRPAIIDCQLECTFPSYMVDEELSLWLPRTVPLTAGTQLPQGTEIILRAEANKPLDTVRIARPETGESKPVASENTDDGRSFFTYHIPTLKESLSLEITLTDNDGIVSERPYRVYITAVADEPPAVDVTKTDVGEAITPDAFLPLRGTIEDDFGLDRTWIELAVNDETPREETFTVGQGGDVATQVDFREERAREGGLTLRPQDTLSLVVKASDRYDLGDGPNVGAGEHYEILVVTPDELLAMLESREIGLRRRFEQIVEETTQTRDMLLRVRNEDPTQAAPGADPEDSAEEDEGDASPDEPTTTRKRGWTVRLLRAQQGLLQSQKSAQESLGVAAAFRDIRSELIANRVDTEDRKRRLEERLAMPLERLGNEQFPELDRRLQRLVAHLETNLSELQQRTEDDPRSVEQADAALQQANDILRTMGQILQDMLDIETYNELLDIVRSIRDEQRRLIEDTKKQQKQQVLDLLR